MIRSLQSHEILPSGERLVVLAKLIGIFHNMLWFILFRLFWPDIRLSHHVKIFGYFE